MNKPTLITGCQRSGTTLLHLILDSHPGNTGVDETAFGKKPLDEYLESPQYHPNVSFKLPAATFQFEFIKTIPGIKVIWCIRDPRDVVLSMLNLKVKISEHETVPWVLHPGGARREIDNIVSSIQGKMSPGLSVLYQKYKALTVKQPAQWTRDEQIFTASLCWRMKNELLPVYQDLGIPCHLLPYESLVGNPEPTLRALLQFIELPWHDNVLNHHKLHRGVSIGDTENSRPIDSANTRKWVQAFDAATLKIIEDTCADIADRLGYPLRPTA